jgi:hypothetical protein
MLISILLSVIMLNVYADCHYAECQNAECRVLFNVMLSVMVPEVTDIDNHSSSPRYGIY